MSEKVVLTLVKRLENEHPDKTLHLTLACDNFFTAHKLFKELKGHGFLAYGTAKNGSGMPKQHNLPATAQIRSMTMDLSVTQWLTELIRSHLLNKRLFIC
jgi:hypothetical protein